MEVSQKRITVPTIKAAGFSNLIIGKMGEVVEALRIFEAEEL